MLQYLFQRSKSTRHDSPLHQKFLTIRHARLHTLLPRIGACFIRSAVLKTFASRSVADFDDFAKMPRQDAVFKQGRYLAAALALTCELVVYEIEALERAQVSDTIRERACECINVCVSSVFDFDCCEYHIRMQSPERTLFGRHPHL